MDSSQQNGGLTGYEDNENYKLYISKKLNPVAAAKLVKLCEKLNLSNEDFDERAVELLATFSSDQANFIIDQLEESQMYGVQNKPQYLMSVMRNFKDRVRALGSQQATNLPLIPGPSVDSIKSIIERTGYQLEVTVGQRKFHNPPDVGEVDPSIAKGDNGNCIYIGQIPRELYEDAMIPLFEQIGKIYDLRLMMDPANGKSRGYAFLIYFDKEHANEAAKKYDGYEIQPGKALKGVVEVIIYSSPDANESRKNRGFCFVDFVDHKAASDAKRRISQGKVRPWNNDLVVDWAEQQDEPDEETMATVKVLYVKNVKEVVTEEQLKEMFEPHGEVERAKKIRDYAFIHFKEREGALAALEAMKGTVLEGVELDISLAKPQGDMKQKKKLALKRGGMGFGPMGGMMGRGGRFPAPDFYGPPGRGRGTGYPKFGQQQYGGFYGADAYGGYPPPAYGGYSGYPDPYASAYAPDPYYGMGPGYAPPGPAGRGGAGVSIFQVSNFTIY
ncbi:RNA recognition motif domain-containing protein [Ditylenchus destructor]|uniref:RNA recognition motif domain-containing protein n=1 Tax=Ditylenchus destructor TaxID=166010 RepID=A0AAD4RAT5_9BILA|nr:RNA recognition motif domain-containing protein [Ditylenchus destructor]